jgi:hypothetical protein
MIRRMVGQAVGELALMKSSVKQLGHLHGVVSFRQSRSMEQATSLPSGRACSSNFAKPPRLVTTRIQRPHELGGWSCSILLLMFTEADDPRAEVV